MVTLDERGQGALPFKMLPSPKEPTQAQRERHNICHWPYESWCPVCVATRRPNDHHRTCLRTDREVPLLVADYAFVRNSNDDALVCVLIARLKPLGVFLACIVPNKGVHEVAIARFTRFIMEMGLVHFTYRSDKEPSIISVIQEACRRSGRKENMSRQKH